MGGYCAFEGETEDGKESPEAFNNQKPWKRLIVLFSGAFFNFLSAIIFSFMLLMFNGYDLVEVKKVEEFTLDVSIFSESVTTAPVLKVTSVDGGAITGLEVKTPGSFTLAEEYGDTLGMWFTSSEYTYSGVGTNAILQVYFSRVYEGGGEVEEVAIVNAGESTTSTVENPVSATGGTGSGAKFNITLGEVFEEVEVTDVPGTMPKPATEVSYVSYSVSYPELPIDYNTTFTREYPVQG